MKDNKMFVILIVLLIFLFTGAQYYSLDWCTKVAEKSVNLTARSMDIAERLKHELDKRSGKISEVLKVEGNRDKDQDMVGIGIDSENQFKDINEWTIKGGQRIIIPEQIVDVEVTGTRTYEFKCDSEFYEFKCKDPIDSKTYCFCELKKGGSYIEDSGDGEGRVRPVWDDRSCIDRAGSIALLGPSKSIR